MWDLPKSGIEPVSLELQGGFLTTGPSGKPLLSFQSSVNTEWMYSWWIQTELGLSLFLGTQGNPDMSHFSGGDSTVVWWICSVFTLIGGQEHCTQKHWSPWWWTQEIALSISSQAFLHPGPIDWQGFPKSLSVTAGSAKIPVPFP